MNMQVHIYLTNYFLSIVQRLAEARKNAFTSMMNKQNNRKDEDQLQKLIKQKEQQLKLKSKIEKNFESGDLERLKESSNQLYNLNKSQEKEISSLNEKLQQRDMNLKELMYNYNRNNNCEELKNCYFDTINNNHDRNDDDNADYDHGNDRFIDLNIDSRSSFDICNIGDTDCDSKNIHENLNNDNNDDEDVYRDNLEYANNDQNRNYIFRNDDVRNNRIGDNSIINNDDTYSDFSLLQPPNNQHLNKNVRREFLPQNKHEQINKENIQIEKNENYQINKENNHVKLQMKFSNIDSLNYEFEKLRKSYSLLITENEDKGNVVGNTCRELMKFISGVYIFYLCIFILMFICYMHIIFIHMW
jgi:hypothetical protein